MEHKGRIRREAKKVKEKPLAVSEDLCTVCPRSGGPIYIESYCIKWVTTSWTYNTRTTFPHSRGIFVLGEINDLDPDSFGLVDPDPDVSNAGKSRV